MTIKELIPKLIAHYDKCINEMTEEGWYIFCLDNNILSGICNASLFEFKKNIFKSRFVVKFTNGELYLCKTPIGAKSYSEAKELLQIRLRRLKEFL